MSDTNTVEEDIKDISGAPSIGVPECFKSHINPIVQNPIVKFWNLLAFMIKHKQ